MADIVTKLFLEDLEVLVDIGIHDFEINKPQRLQVSAVSYTHLTLPTKA